ncbi:unnamed protein product [Bemisia tabaci]|uniref:Glutathione peroxidase n=1 Tax=Bemisia tabaci TaxID=7038 RepID=A0A9P0CEQ2_BEMTA|nr:unnamed protein product [Bemisia tabaci]
MNTWLVILHLFYFSKRCCKLFYHLNCNNSTMKGNVLGTLKKIRGHPLLIVNVASQCGYTGTHYKELAELDEKYRESKGLRILAFPCNQFGGQEPGSNEEISCSIKKYSPNFDIFAKIDVNGNNAHPLFKYLKHKQGGLLIDAIKWNFTKFIIDKNGQPVARHAANKNPLDLIPELEKVW